jgi:hypothetical protein
MRYLIKLDNEYEVIADDKDLAVEKLAEKFNEENMTAENEFWANIEVIGEDEVKFNI